MLYAIILMVVGGLLAVGGFHFMKPKSGEVPTGGGGFVDAGPEEKSPVAQQAGKIMMGVGIILFAGGLVWVLSTLFMALAGVVLVLGVIALIWYLIRTR